MTVSARRVPLLRRARGQLLSSQPLRLLSRQWADPLARAGVYLLVNTGLTGVLGFLYWILAAHLYPQAAVGRGGALVSASTLLSGVGQLNLSGMLMRFLPKSGARSRQLAFLTYAAACGSSLLLTAIAGIGVYVLTPHASPLRMAPVVAALFAASVAATVVFTLQDSLLIAVRRSVFVPIENGSFGVAKIALLVVFAPMATWSAIFASWMLPLVATIPVINWVLFRRLLPRAGARTGIRTVSTETKKQIGKFVVGDASAGIFTQTWTYILPVLVTAALGARVNALFYVAFLFTSTVDLVAGNFALPLVVEGAHEPDQLFSLLDHVVRRVYAVVVPIVALFVLCAPLVLRVYGHQYVEAASTLRILSVACLPKAFSSAFNGACRVLHRTYVSAILQGFACIVIVVGTLLVSDHGLVAIATVVLVAQLAIAAAAGVLVFRWRGASAARLLPARRGVA